MAGLQSAGNGTDKSEPFNIRCEDVPMVAKA